MSVTAANYQTNSASVTLTSNQNVNIQLTPTPLFARSGVGDNVFDMPASVGRIRITGAFSGFSSNFIVYIGGRLIVNELLGTGWRQTTFEGTYVVPTGAGVTEIKLSGGVAWTFTEVR